MSSHEEEFDSSELPMSSDELPTFDENDPETKRAHLKDLIENKKKVKKKGIVYISRVPPGMKPFHLKKVLSDYCEVERVWCTATDNDKKKSRKAPSEAWVEISSAKKAKRLANLLHMNPMGYGRYKEDLWNMKYLKDVEWHHLSTQFMHKKKMREKRLQQHIADAKKNANFFLQQIEKQRHEDTVNERKRKRGENEEEPKEETKSIKRTYKQKESVDKGDNLDDDLLKKLFSK